jgi:general secretion pathway protein J
MNPTSRRRPQAGFTLIEVLVAITLMALVSLLAWRGLSQVAATREWLDNAARDNEIVIRTLGQLDRDLSLAQGGRNANDVAQAGHPLPPGVDVLQSAGLPPELDIVRSSAVEDGGWQRVIWKIHNGALWRYTGASGGRYPLPAATDGAALMPDVNTIGIRVWIAGQGWVGLPATGPGKATGIEVTVQRTANGRPERYTRVVILQ